MTTQPWTKADLRQMAAKGDRMAATVLMLWERAETAHHRTGGMDVFGPDLADQTQGTGAPRKAPAGSAVTGVASLSPA